MRHVVPLLVVFAAACTAPAPEFRFAGVYRCGPEIVLDAWTSANTLRLESPARTYELTRVPAASGVRWQGGNVAFHEKGQAALFVRDDVQHDCRIHESVMQAVARGVDYRAIGQEPGWLLEISEEAQVTLEYDYGQRAVAVPYVEPVEREGAKRFEIHHGETHVDVKIVTASCRDVMSGQPYPDTVTVNISDAGAERTLTGCGRPLPRHVPAGDSSGAASEQR